MHCRNLVKNPTLAEFGVVPLPALFLPCLFSPSTGMADIRRCADDVEEGIGIVRKSCNRNNRTRNVAFVVTCVAAVLALGAICTLLSGQAQRLGGPSLRRHRVVLDAIREADYKDGGENLMRKIDDITDWKLDWALKHNPNAMNEIEHDAGHIGIHLQVEQLPADMRANVNPAGMCFFRCLNRRAESIQYQGSS